MPYCVTYRACEPPNFHRFPYFTGTRLGWHLNRPLSQITCSLWQSFVLLKNWVFSLFLLQIPCPCCRDSHRTFAFLANVFRIYPCLPHLYCRFVLTNCRGSCRISLLHSHCIRPKRQGQQTHPWPLDGHWHAGQEKSFLRSIFRTAISIPFARSTFRYEGACPYHPFYGGEVSEWWRCLSGVFFICESVFPIRECT